MDRRPKLNTCDLVLRAVRAFGIAALLPFTCQAQPAPRQDRPRAEIRLAAPLASVPSNAAVSADGRFVLVSTTDGSVSTFDLNSRYGQTDVLITAPIRDEELQKQRPVALSPSGNLVALGVPLERDVADSARIYFFRLSDTRNILYTIDGLPSRPLQLGFIADRGERLLLVALFADKQPPRVWDVSKIRGAARDPAAGAVAVDPGTLVPRERQLPEPVADFFRECGSDRSECHSFGFAVPPNADSDIGLVIGGDSGIVVYDRKFSVAAYAHMKDGRQDMRRVSGISFSPDGKRVAISRRNLSVSDNYANDSCSVHVYDVSALLVAGSERKITAEPLFKLKAGTHLGNDGVCYFANVVWTGDAIFASGNFVAAPAAGQVCKTFSTLEPTYLAYANMLVRWNATADAAPTYHCLGANTAMDLRPIEGGGVVAITQDPSLTVFDAKGNVSAFPAQPNFPRYFEGPIFDTRDGARGALLTNADGSIVMLRPLGAPRSYVALDLTAPLNTDSFISAKGAPDDAKAGLQKALASHRDQPIAFEGKAQGPGQCLGVTFPANADRLTGEQRTALTASLTRLLKFRPVEAALTFQFIEPAANESEWRLVLGTSHRLLFARCDGQDLWSGKPVAETAFPGKPIRNEAYQIAVSGDRKFVVVAHADGMLRWYRMSNGDNLLSAFLRTDLRSWVAWTAQGYFDYSFTGGSQIASWVQSKPTGGGSWSIDLQPLSRFNKDWYNPQELQKVFSDVQADRDVKTSEVVPDTGRPRLEVTVAGGDKLKKPRVELNIQTSTTNPGSLLSPLVVYIDGVGRMNFPKAPVRKEQGKGLRIDASFDLPPCLQRPGKGHRLWVEFEGTKESRFLTYDGDDSGVTDCGQKRVWGIAVGISKYDKESASLKYADQDAQRFFDFWAGHWFYKVGRMALLTAPAAGAGKTVVKEGDSAAAETSLAAADNTTVSDFIQREIKAISTKAQSGDVVLLYFAGHGFSMKNTDVDHWFFMPSDGKVDDPFKTAIDIPTVVAWLRASKFDSMMPLLVFLDACRDLKMFPEKIAPNRQKRARPDFTDLTNDYNSIMFLAAGSGESAFELPETDLKAPKNIATCEPSAPDEKQGGGAFTHVLLDVLNLKKLKDPDGQVSLRELGDRLLDDVPAICARQKIERFSVSPSFQGLFFKN